LDKRSIDDVVEIEVLLTYRLLSFATLHAIDSDLFHFRA